MTKPAIRMAFGAAALLAISTTSASAGDAFWGGLSASATVTSDYRFRGISQSDRNPAVQGSIDWIGPQNFYVGSWASLIDFNDKGVTSKTKSRVEWDIYAGKHFALGSGTDLNVEAIYYAYPDYDPLPGVPRKSYFEGLTTLTQSWDAWSVHVTGAWSPDYLSSTGTGFYLAGGAAYQMNDWITLSGNVGEQWVRDLNRVPGAGFPYTHWDAGVTLNWNHFALDARYVDTSLSRGQCGSNWCNGGAVVSLTYSFGG